MPTQTTTLLGKPSRCMMMRAASKIYWSHALQKADEDSKQEAEDDDMDSEATQCLNNKQSVSLSLSNHHHLVCELHP